MTNTDYNGWTNYATWRVNLEIFDGFDPYTDGGYDSDVTAYHLGSYLKEYAEEIVLSSCGDGGLNTRNLAADYALAFLADVNWYEIAKNMIKNYAETEAV